MPILAINKQFIEAEKVFDLDRLYDDLAAVKGKGLTTTEKVYLRGLLCGHSPTEIADKLNKARNTVAVNLSNTLYPYLKRLLNKEDYRINNWRNVSQWLKEVGYERSFEPLTMITALPAQATINIEKIKKDQLLINVNIQMIASLSPHTYYANLIDDDNE
ncbi:MAG: helix-turn-helix domain-containing protein [Thioploca sp.]|nr:helix-turn-helix domain-containing protein [Thioploca sp.]